MNFSTLLKKLRLAALALVALAVMAGPSFAQTYNLCATTGTVTIAGESIDIWGFGLVQNGSCSATLPGPVLRATAGETLTINLTNNLAERVSFFVTGLRPASAGGTPGKFTGEVAPGAAATYTFTPRPGTFLYHSATDRLRTHVPMGLYGALVVDSAAATATTPAYAYAGVPYNQDEVLVFSAIDPNLNADPGTFDGAKVMNWFPQYFLINGAAHPETAHMALTAGSDVLLRLVNAGLKSIMPTLEGGLYMDLVAEDGNPYPHPLKQYGVELPAAKTIDAMITVTEEGSYALYDRALNLTSRGALGGGMLTYLDVGGGAGILKLSAATYSVGEGDGSLTVTVDRVGGSAGAVSVDYATVDGTATVGSDYTAASGTLNFASGVTSATFSITILEDTVYEANETFTVSLSNPQGGATLGTPSTATVTIIDNDEGPGALQFSAATYSVGEGDGSLTVTVDRVGGSAGDVSVSYATADGTATAGDDYTSNSGTLTFGNGVSDPQSITIAVENDTDYEGNETFTVSLSNPQGGATLGTPSSAVVTIIDDDSAPNVAPFANDDYAETPRNTAITINVVANDVDPDGTIDPSSVVVTTGTSSQMGGTVTNNGNGTVTFNPKRGFRGTDTFQYTVKDNAGAASNVATVRVNVLR
jgi:hypothetical protein